MRPSSDHCPLPLCETDALSGGSARQVSAAADKDNSMEGVSSSVESVQAIRTEARMAKVNHTMLFQAMPLVILTAPLKTRVRLASLLAIRERLPLVFGHTHALYRTEGKNLTSSVCHLSGFDKQTKTRNV